MDARVLISLFMFISYLILYEIESAQIKDDCLTGNAVNKTVMGLTWSGYT